MKRLLSLLVALMIPMPIWAESIILTSGAYYSVDDISAGDYILQPDVTNQGEDYALYQYCILRGGEMLVGDGGKDNLLYSKATPQINLTLQAGDKFGVVSHSSCDMLLIPAPIPDITAMDATIAAQALAEYYSEGMPVIEAKKTNNYITIIMHANCYYTRDAFVRSCCRVMLNVSEHLFGKDEFDSLTMKFTVPGRDKYGNESTLTGMTITLYRSTAGKINYEYMRNILGTSTKRFLQITDAYFAHPDMMDSVY